MVGRPPRARLVLPALLALLLGGLLAPVAAGDVPPPPPRSVWTVYTRVEAEVVDDYATVKVIAQIGNRGPDPEFPFVVTVPDTAMVTGLTLLRDGVLTEADIAERGEARAQYEDHKAAQMTGALVEKERGAQRFRFLVNVAEFESAVATLTYEQLLVADQGLHSLPLEAPVSGFGQDLGAEFTVRITHRDGVTLARGEPAAESTSQEETQILRHRVGARTDQESTPFTAHYATGATPDGGSLRAVRLGGQGYFAHRFQAAPEAAQQPVDLVLVLDTSGSMSGARLVQMKDAAVQVIRTLDAQDRLQLSFFASSVYGPWEGLRPADAATRSAAIAAVQESVAAGSTAIESALRSGLGAFGSPDAPPSVAGRDAMPLVVFLTDGQPTVGERDATRLRAIASEANLGDARLFGLAFGADADWHLVAGLARDQGGLALPVPEGEGAEVDLGRFMAALTTPVLRDVEVDYATGATAFTTTVPVLFAGSELLWVGRFEAGPGVSGTVTGHAADGERRYPFEAAVQPARTHEVLPRLVAYAEIRRLESLIAAEGERDDWVEELVALALGFGFVTDYTSLVVTLDGPSLDEPCDCGPVTVAAGAPAGTSTTGAPAPGMQWDAAGRLAGDRLDGAPDLRPADDRETERDGPGASTAPRDTPAPGATAGLALLALAAALRRRRGAA